MPAPPPRPAAAAALPPPAPGPGAGLYLHVPFCSAVCPYCDFAVTVGGERSRATFRRALLAEVERLAAEPAAAAWGSCADTVYFGGGTPSSLPPEMLAEILEALADRLGVRRDGPGAARVLLEANPEDVTPEAAAAWRRLGVDTLSLGVQSFDAAALAFLGRRHDPRRARESVEIARDAGFGTVSLDLIYGLPGQDAAALARELATAVGLGPDHLSCYQLTVEPRTAFGARRARGELVELDADGQAERFRQVHRTLAAAGWTAYEVSSFARAPGHRSPHNRKYWEHTPYLGLGPAAHSFDGVRHRWWNPRRLAFWRAAVERGGLPCEGGEALSSRQLAAERLMLAVRTAEGLDLGELASRYGVEPTAADRELIARLVEAGLARPEPGRLALTLEGWAVADALAARFSF